MHFEREKGGVPPPHVPSSPPLLSYLGVYEPTSPASYSGVEEFTRLIGYRPRIAVYYSSWFEPFQTTFAQAAHAHGASPMVQIEPSGISLAAIAAGEYDSYLAACARAVRSYGQPVIFSFGHEMNADWYSWGTAILLRPLPTSQSPRLRTCSPAPEPAACSELFGST
jgi:hypothetical protein